MQILHLDLPSPPAFPLGCVLTQGTFDGIHPGHVELLRTVQGEGRRLGLPSVLLTLNPHPATVLRPSRRMPLLTTREERTEILEKLGLDYLAYLAFNTNLAILQAEQYVSQILVGKFSAKVVAVGYNHTFGRKREGTGQFLESVSARYGFEVRILNPVLFEGEPVHSSRIRAELIEGRFNSAVKMLNRPYRISGAVVEGRGIGRKIGYPTINVRAHKDKLIPNSGVYAAKVRTENSWMPGMMYIGENRTIFDCEVNIFDFSGDLYGKHVDVDILAKTRESITFSSTDRLVEQIAADETRIRAILSGR